MAKNKAGKSEKSEKKFGGPFLAAAVFCESIMEDVNGKVSALSIIDGCQLYVPHDTPDNAPSESQPAMYVQNLLLIFRSGDAPGKHKLRLVIEQPSGKRAKGPEREVELSSPAHGGSNVKINAILPITGSGLYWTDIILDGKRITRMPFNVEVQRLPSPLITSPTKGSGKK